MFALALAAAGFGHRFASAAELERAQFAQVFGADFCLTDEDGNAIASGSCPVCHLVASIWLPEAVTGALARVDLAFVVLSIAPAPVVLTTRAAAPPPSRGPPTV